MRIPSTALLLSFGLCLPLAAQAADPLPRARPKSVGMSSERLALIRKQIDAEIARDQLPGAVLAIARRGKLVHFEAYGYLDKAAGVPMRTDAIFNIASMTKPMAAVAALQLYEQGKLLIDDPVSKYFPQVREHAGSCDGREAGSNCRARTGRPQDHDTGLVPPHLGADLRRTWHNARAQALPARQHAGG